MVNTIIQIIWTTLTGFLLCHLAVISIGNREYSIFYQTHFLLKRKGLCRLIYLKPRHFHRYAADEAIYFFASYFSLIAGAILIVAVCAFNFDSFAACMISAGLMVFFFLSDFVRIVVIDITVMCEEKFYKRNEVDIDDYRLWKSYQIRLGKIKKDDAEAIEKLDDAYIYYFKNYKRLRLIKENKDGSLQIAVKKES